MISQKYQKTYNAGGRKLRAIGLFEGNLVVTSWIRDYLPVKVGFRFSTNAPIPSFWSAVAKQRPKTSAS